MFSCTFAHYIKKYVLVILMNDCKFNFIKSYTIVETKINHCNYKKKLNKYA